MNNANKQPDPQIELNRLEQRSEIDISQGNWEQFAACRSMPPETFFPTDTKGVEAAKKICDICVVKEDCLQYALDTRQDNGIWGGTSERQRRKMRKIMRLN